MSFDVMAEEEQLDIQKAPVIVPVGPFEFAPIMEIGEYFNDNIFQNNRFKKNSLINEIHAGGQWSWTPNVNNYSLTYALKSTLYHNSPQDDYIDHYLGFNTHTEFNSRNRLDFDLKYLDSHYQRGVFLGRDILGPASNLTEPDQFHQYGANALYRYGGQKAKGNLELLASVDDMIFDNNLDSNKRLNRTLINMTPGFNYRALPKTILHAQVESTWMQHDELDYSEYDNNKQRYLVGASWLYSKQSQVRGRIGYLQQNYEHDSFENYSDFTWDLSLAWSPLTYSKLNVAMGRNAYPNVGSANIRVSDRYKIDWSHDWTARISTKLSGSYESADNMNIQRQDNYQSVGFDLNYGVQRWLGFGVNYTYRTLQSGNESLDFDQNSILFYVTGNPRISDNIKTPWASWY